MEEAKGKEVVVSVRVKKMKKDLQEKVLVRSFKWTEVNVKDVKREIKSKITSVLLSFIPK